MKTKRVFVRYVSHEIRTPLNITILGLKYLEDIMTPSNTSQQQQQLTTAAAMEVLDDVKGSCTIAVEILNDLLLYEKLDDGFLTLAKTKSRLKKFIDEASRIFKIQAKSADVSFFVESDQVHGVVVEIDKCKLHQVLRNLMSNALKFTNYNGTVLVSCKLFQQREIEKDVKIIFSPILLI